MRTDHLLGLADALGASGAYDEAIRQYEEVAKLADRCGDGYQRLRVLNNLAFTQYQAGMGAEAVITAEQLLVQAEADGQPLQSHDFDTIARAYIAVGRFDDAIHSSSRCVRRRSTARTATAWCWRCSPSPRCGGLRETSTQRRRRSTDAAF